MRSSNFQFGVLILLLAALATPIRAQTSSPGQPLARVGADVIYDRDLTDLIGSSLFQLRNQEFELKANAVDYLVSQRLISAEARAKGTTPEALLEEVYKTLKPPSDSEVEAYYLGQKDRVNRPFAELKEQLEKALTDAKRQQARKDYADRLRNKAQVAILLSRPLIEVTPDPARLRGDPEAPVTIVEFSDFQCPYCQAAEPTIKALLEKYKDKVRLGFRDLPLRQIHGQAQQAAGRRAAPENRASIGSITICFSPTSNWTPQAWSFMHATPAFRLTGSRAA